MTETSSDDDGDLLPIALTAHPDPEALARALAAHVAEALRRRIASDGAASLAVSGGRTPIRFFEALSGAPLDWDKITVTLVDERWVPETSERSNAALVRRHLLQGPAAAAHFVPLYTGDATPEDGLEDAHAAMAMVPRPFAAVVLGMGDDAHTASFFPGAPTLYAAIDPRTDADLVAVHAATAGEPRITFTIRPLIGADALFLHIEGPHKRMVLDAAREPGDALERPIRAILLHSPRPLDVLWCP
ncbi:6-phosphogluconolactonase [Azorhizobium oxalatiphilum]|uniref:6-phosphogluconolactonase n=1 Tax=Azorhizobium oxalatiphilum TaxID=980631 RepID=A0A917FBM4_9HYPH|nr:6-phosphogluconolactonase [Azorhizobium oxalatiphilum]GGF65507.1 6-phosphogluconolactonase [Azorhizobium oxalatiphilum]